MLEIRGLAERRTFVDWESSGYFCCLRKEPGSLLRSSGNHLSSPGQVSLYVNPVYKLEKQKTNHSDKGQKVWHLGFKSIQMRRVCP
jgi:hypothetical protein